MSERGHPARIERRTRKNVLITIKLEFNGNL